MKNYKGSNNPNWKGGRTKLICPICNNIFYVKRYRLNRNKSKIICCSKKCWYEFVKVFYKGSNNPNFGNGDKIRNTWKNPEYRNKVIKNTFKALHLHPNKPEQLLNELLNFLFPKKYIYVGTGKRIIGGFIPDFIDFKNMRIIELFGDYWHSLPNYRKRDVKRLKVYDQLGYKTLVIWQKELNNLEQLQGKLIAFEN